jgi:hypothetical protein
MSRREQFVISAADGGHDLASTCAALIDALRDAATVVHIDAYSDYGDQMPGDIRAAEAWLRARGLARGVGDPGLAVAVEPADEVGWTIARAYAPWSSRVALFDAEAVNIATLQDGGRFITLNLTVDLVEAVTEAVGPAAAPRPLAAIALADGDDRNGGA